MKQSTEKILDELLTRYQTLQQCKGSIVTDFHVIYNTYKHGGKLLLCGNGGSASDCEHIVCELAKSFRKHRQLDCDFVSKVSKYPDGEMLCQTLQGGLPAISLTSQPALFTAFANDNNPTAVFAQQIYVLGNVSDTLVAISTSGNSQNCILASEVAKAKGLNVVALRGQNPSKLSALADVTINVPATETYAVQELHLPVYHCLCAMLEEELF